MVNRFGDPALEEPAAARLDPRLDQPAPPPRQRLNRFGDPAVEEPAAARLDPRLDQPAPPPRQRLNRFGDPAVETVADPTDGRFTANFLRGVLGGAQDVAESFGAAKDVAVTHSAAGVLPPPPGGAFAPSARFADMSFGQKVTDQGWWGDFLGRTIVGSAPFLGGAVVGAVGGGVTGEMMAGPPGAAVGSLGGSMLGGGAMAGIQQMGGEYLNARRAGRPHDQAVDVAIKSGFASAGINAASIPAAIIRPFRGALSNVLLQAVGVQPGIGVADVAAQNKLAQAYDPGRAVLANAPEAFLGEALFEGPATAAAVAKTVVPRLNRLVARRPMQPWEVSRAEFVAESMRNVPADQHTPTLAEAFGFVHRYLVEERVKAGQKVPPEGLSAYDDLSAEVAAAAERQVRSTEQLKARAKLSPEKDDILTAVRKLGGIADIEGGDLAVMFEGHPPSFLGPLVQREAPAGQAQKGLTLDKLAEALHEAGYLRERDTAELLDSLDSAARGRVVTSLLYDYGADPLGVIPEEAPPAPTVVQAPPAPPVVQAPPAPPVVQAPPAPPVVQAPPAPPVVQAPPAPPVVQAPPAPPVVQAPPAPPVVQAPPAPTVVQAPP
ncbi:MAG: hypothetical protein OEW11_11215, partial [Nitrospirota bacterium]|nr:hypothetical protein [Nitrospirota bacterium]